MNTRFIRAACPHDCPDTCAMLVTVTDGIAVKVQGDPDHPATHGALCTKVSRYPERTYHPDRVLHPLKRIAPKSGTGGGARFERVSWDNALRDIAARLSGIASRDPQAILPYSYAGTMGLVQGESMAARFFHRLGASLLDRTICAGAGTEAMAASYGDTVGMHVEHFVESRLILIWGSNSIGSNLHFWTMAQEAKRQGAKLICIDPRRTETADRCHQHVALMPGTDGALALGLMHELIVHDRLDHDYIERHVEQGEGGVARAARACHVMAARARGRGLRHHCRRGEIAGPRLRLDGSGCDPPELRHAAGARGWERGAPDRDAALPDRCLAPPCRRIASVELRLVPGCPQRCVVAASGSAWRARRPPCNAAHPEHEHDR